MPFGPEELERRRQQREALQAKREAQQKQLKIRLIVAAVVLAVAAVVILIVALSANKKDRDKDDDPETTVSTTAAAQETTGAAAQKPKSDKTVIHFAAAGDLNVVDRVVASGGAGMNYTQLLADVVPVLGEADLTVVNFEGNAVGPPYGTATSSAPMQLLQALKSAGVDMVQMANSRAISNGVTGLTASLDQIRDAGLEPVGAYASNEDFEDNGGYTMWEVEGVRIAVVAFTKGMDNMALPEGSEKCVNLLYTDYSSKYVEVDTKGITAILDRVEKEKPDVTVALVHWGSEFNDTHSTSQEEIRKLMLEHGVDAIIGTHPHYVQNIDYDKKAGTLVAYSLGDFVGDGQRAGTNYSIILDLEITKDHKNETAKITGYSYTPIFSYEDGDGNLRILRIDPAVKAYEGKYIDAVPEEVYNAMISALERIEARIKP